MKKIGRGLGLDITKAVLAAGHAVVATGRNKEKVAQAIGEAADLLVATLNITKPADAEAAVQATAARFGRLDVLVNNAANFYAGFFEELRPTQMSQHRATSLLGPMNVTRAVLPVLRQQQAGQIITISATAGLVGFEFGTTYAASKFGLEGWRRSLAPAVAPFGIEATTVNPGFFRTELLTDESTSFADLRIADYAERRAGQEQFWKGYNGQQGGDPAKLAQALLTISGEAKPPRRFIAGADAIGTAQQVIADLQQDIESYQALSSSLAFGEPAAANQSSGAGQLSRQKRALKQLA